MFGKNLSRVAAPLTALFLSLAIAHPARAQEPARRRPGAVPTEDGADRRAQIGPILQVTDPDPRPLWRKIAFPTAVIAAGVGVVGGVGFKLRESSRNAAFNAHQMPDAPPGKQQCNATPPDRGGPVCAALLDDARSAARWANIAFATAGAFAVTAILLKLTDPRSGSGETTRLACAPGLGLSASCAMTF